MKKLLQLFPVLISLATLIPFPTIGQNRNVPADNRLRHHEAPDKPYKPNAFGNQRTSPALKYRATDIVTVQVNVDANGFNILGDAANEPSIGVNPQNPDEMVIGWRQFDDVGSDFRQAGYAFTTDGGLTWTFPGKIEAGIFRSDPVLEFDSYGTAFYNSLTSNNGIYTCKVFRSFNGGANWDEGADARGGDKQWMTIDRTPGPGKNNIYAVWNQNYSSCQPGFFTRSTNNGDSFEPCIMTGGTPYWGTMAVGNDGELFVTGAGDWGNLVVTRSMNAPDTVGAMLWDLTTEVEMDGYLASGGQINPVGLIGQAYIDVDRSGGPGNGNVYVLASMVRMSINDNADVMFARSTDGGLTWDAPVRVNDDPGTGNWQWFGTMSVAPTGRIDAAWLDTRDGISGTLMSALYYSYSTDQGQSWSPNIRLSEPFDPHVGWPMQNKMGDYFDMKSDATGARLAWANTLNGEQDVYYSYITPDISGTDDFQNGPCLHISACPNPFTDKTVIRYSISTGSEVTIIISDALGKPVKTIREGYQQAGSHQVEWSSGLPAGYYTCHISAGKGSNHLGLIKSR